MFAIFWKIIDFFLQTNPVDLHIFFKKFNSIFTSLSLKITLEGPINLCNQLQKSSHKSCPSYKNRRHYCKVKIEKTNIFYYLFIVFALYCLILLFFIFVYVVDLMISNLLFLTEFTRASRESFKLFVK